MPEDQERAKALPASPRYDDYVRAAPEEKPAETPKQAVMPLTQSSAPQKTDWRLPRIMSRAEAVGCTAAIAGATALDGLIRYATEGAIPWLFLPVVAGALAISFTLRYLLTGTSAWTALTFFFESKQGQKARAALAVTVGVLCLLIRLYVFMRTP